MTVYYCLYGILLVSGLIFVKRDNKIELQKKQNRNYTIFACILLILLFAFRHPSMGADLGYNLNSGYLSGFKVISERNWYSVFTDKYMNYERAYIILNKLIGIFANDIQIFLFMIAITALIPIFYYIYKNSDDVVLSTVIFMGIPVFQMYFSGLRQVLAIGITTLSIKFIQEKKIIKFFLVVFLASAFHYSAMIFLAAYPIYFIKSNTNLIKTLSAIAIPVIYVLRYPLFKIFSTLFKDDATAKDTGAIMLFLVFTAIYVFLLIFADDNDTIQVGLRNLFLVACVCQAFGSIYTTAMRVGYYFMIALPVLLPRVLSYLKKNSENDKEKDQSYIVMYIVIFAAFVIFGLFSLKNGTWSMSFPYYFYWEEVAI